eukprot:Tamp_12828.p1 GENE.Tamp_12828~~Tamp_12828.p1  ORF type:complete len:478 (-),score=144.80 Tamp_12828:342-1712(-)
MSGTSAPARRLPAAPVLAVGVAALACCVLAAWVGGGEARAAAPVARLQEGVFTPGIQETFVPQQQGGGARQQSLLAGYVAMGTVGGGQHGLHNAPPPPPPTWAQGGHSWVYDGIYGNHQRPTTGIWAQKGFGGPMGGGGAPAPDDGGVEEEDRVPTEEPSEPAAEAEPAAEPGAETPAQDFAEPADEGEPAAAEEQPAVEEVEEPNGQVEEVEEEPAAAEEPAQEEQQPAAEPEGECDDEEDCGGGAVVVNVPGAPQMPAVQPQPVPYPVPAVASQQLPMEWAAEDAAEHAYNLAQWRVKILRAKMEQAKLRKQLMAVTMGATEGTPEAGGDSAEDDEDEDRGRSSRGRGGGLRQGELVAVKQSLLSLAQETVGAIKQLKTQMMSLKKAVCCGNEKKAPVQSLEQVEEKSALQRAVARVKAQKEKQVLKMKKKMDAQLSSLLTKVTTLIKDKRRGE